MVFLTAFGMEWIIIIAAIVILLIFGPKKLPELARGLGKASAEFRRGKMEVERQLREEELTYQQKQAAAASAGIDAKVLKAAKELGIETAGKSEKDLKHEIAAKMAE